MAAVGLGPTLANAMLQLLDGNYEWVQLHTDQPGSAGTANIAAMATRIEVEWDVASAGSISITLDLSITSVPATETWRYWSAWSASTAGTFGLSGQVTATQVTTGDDVTIDSASVTVTFTLASS
jgi:hypothetical protein